MRVSLGVLGAIWLCGIVLGVRYMLRYDTTPGMAATPESSWPIDLPIQRAMDRPTIVMVAQPACSCTEASISDLETAISQHPNRARVFIIFENNSRSVDAQSSSLWKAALRVPGAIVQIDPAGMIRDRLHAATSGQVFAFDPTGKLWYSGGITASRGHAGESDGSRAIGDLLSGKASEISSAPVFGCATN